jgi:hypothetical protein
MWWIRSTIVHSKKRICARLWSYRLQWPLFTGRCALPTTPPTHNCRESPRPYRAACSGALSLQAYKFCEWGRHIVKEGPVCVLQGKKKTKNKDSHLVLFNDKIALFRVKAKGKRRGYKVLHVWEGNQLICLPLEWPTTVLSQSSPGLGATPPGVVRLRTFSRSANEGAALSPRNPAPAYSSPRGRSTRNLRDSDLTEPIDEGTAELPARSSNCHA